MISVDGLAVEFGGTTLFSDISFVINEKDRIALMGKNGAGKSTLLKILAGVRQPTRGKVSAPKECVVAYLPQHLMTEDGRTVFDETAQAFAHLHEMEAQIEKLNKELETRTDYESDSYMALIEEVSSLSEKYYSIDATNYEEDVEKALLGLGFRREDFGRQTSDFSGGWRMRIELAELLLQKPGVLLLVYLIGAMKRAGKLPANAAALKTIVTTEMTRAVAEANGLDCYDTFTGFKFMAEKMNELEGAGKNTVIFSYEESYGYMIGHYVRDKDAVTASLLLTEMAAWYYSQGMTLFDALNALFVKYGWYGEKTHNLVMPGLDGAEKMAALMKSLRETPPSEIAGVKVATYKDYSDGTARDAASGEVTKIALSGSNVLRFELCDGTPIVVRPSGTEPKIKVYILTKGSDAQERDANLAKYSAWVNTLA